MPLSVVSEMTSVDAMSSPSHHLSASKSTGSHLSHLGKSTSSGSLPFSSPASTSTPIHSQSTNHISALLSHSGSSQSLHVSKSSLVLSSSHASSSYSSSYSSSSYSSPSAGSHVIDITNRNGLHTRDPSSSFNDNNHSKSLINPELTPIPDVEDEEEGLLGKEKPSHLHSSPSLTGINKRFKVNIFSSIAEHYEFAMLHAKYEWRLAKLNARVLIIAIIFQYVHKIATNVAYVLHTQAKEPLFDAGFYFLPALTPQFQIISEILFFTFFVSSFAFSATPFVKALSPNRFINSNKNKQSQPVYTIQMLSRYCAVLVMAQFLRCVCFLVTSLPGPNYHCRLGSHDYNPPNSVYKVLTHLDAFFGCGDLVFSSHTIFVCMSTLMVCKYAQFSTFKKVLAAIMVVLFGLVVVAARKHYTLDIVVALYTVPLLWIAYEHYYPDYIPPDLFDDLPQEEFERKRSMTSVE